MALFGNKKKEETAPKNAPKKEAKVTVKSEEAVSMKDLYTESGSKTVKAVDNKTKKTSVSVNINNILIRPLVTEKATNLNSTGKYVFVVSLKANKIEIANAVESIYGIKPLQVNLSNVKGKRVARGRIRGQRSNWRKAIITLPAGKSIKIYEGV